MNDIHLQMYIVPEINTEILLTPKLTSYIFNTNVYKQKKMHYTSVSDTNKKRCIILQWVIPRLYQRTIC